MEKTCENCGSVYKLTAMKIGMRDKDTIDCEVCGELLHSWNEAKIWNAHLVKKNENHLQGGSNHG